MTTRWLITGGCGFIGRNLIRKLRQQRGDSHTIRILDNLSNCSIEDHAELDPFVERSAAGIEKGPNEEANELVIGDILDPATVRAASKGVDVVAHLAANTGVATSVDDPRRDCEINIVGTLNCLEAARHLGIRRFVFASSGAPIGEAKPPIHEEMAAHPVSPYGASKLAGEGYCSSYYRTFGVETVALRFSNVYGPGSAHKNSIIAKLIRLAIEGETLEIYGDGRQTRDFLYIDDLVAAIVEAAKRPKIGGEVFQIATSLESSVNDVVKALIGHLRRVGIAVPEICYGEQRLGDVLRNFSDTSKAKQLLKWEAAIGIDEGLKQTIAWFLQHYHDAARNHLSCGDNDCDDPSEASLVMASNHQLSCR